jgi:ABC-type glycerol-3-phosphate transport system substrate-binding protein
MDKVVWKELTSEQQNALVAEKVMGVSVVTFPNGAHATTDDGVTISGIPKPYTTDMNAAWDVVERMASPEDDAFDYNPLCFTNWWDSTSLWGAKRNEAARMICIVALRACGVDVEYA